jgi:hypothetical protein
LRAFVAHSPVDKPEKKNSVRLGIKKLTHASNSPSDDQPTAEVSKSYLMGSSTLHVEATLDKRVKIGRNLEHTMYILCVIISWCLLGGSHTRESDSVAIFVHVFAT